MANGWSFLAGAANAYGGYLQNQQQTDQKLKLQQMQEDAQMKRQMFLEQYRQELDDKSAEKKHERESEDVTASFNDPETGNVYGRTKGGKTVVLNETSGDYQSQLAEAKKNKVALEEAQLKNAMLQPELTRAQTEAAAARAFRTRNPTPKAAPKDPDLKTIQDAYKSRLKQLNDPKNPDPEFNAAMADEGIRGELGQQFDPAKISKALGPSAKEQIAMSFDKSNGAPAPRRPQQQSPSQPNAPSVEVLMQQANAAVKAGADPAKVEARLKEAMAKFGYIQ
jgi:hypothetical protein